MTNRRKRLLALLSQRQRQQEARKLRDRQTGALAALGPKALIAQRSAFRYQR